MAKVNNSKREIVKMLLSQDITNEKKDDLIDLLLENSIVLDVDREMSEISTWKDRLADKITSVAGSWEFIILFGLFIILWMLINVFLLKKVDPYPFILLNLLLSCLSAFQAPIIMMSQNRASIKDSLRSKNDYKTDLKSELILEELHIKLKEVLKNQKEILKYMKE